MHHLLEFPPSVRFIPNEDENAVVEIVDTLAPFPGPTGSEAAQLCALMLSIPQVARRLGLTEDVPAEIDSAADVVQLITAALEQHYLDGLPVSDVWRQIKSLCDRPEVIEIYDTIMSHRPGGIRDVDRWH